MLVNLVEHLEGRSRAIMASIVSKEKRGLSVKRDEELLLKIRMLIHFIPGYDEVQLEKAYRYGRKL